METTSKRVEVTFTWEYSLIQHTCPHCGDNFSGVKTKVYCTPRCAHRAAWERNGSRYLQNKLLKGATKS